MTQREFSAARLESRSRIADNATIASRIESYRIRTPLTDSRMLIEPEDSNGTEAQMRGTGAADTAQGSAIPEIPAADLSASVLRSAIAGHGSLIVRGLFTPASMEALVPVIDKVLDACDRHGRGETPAPSTYFDPPGNLLSILPNRERELLNTRNFHRDSGSAMCIEAPSVAEALLRLYEANNIKALVTEYLGEAPCLTVKKWVLRRSKLPVAEAGWHQDGAFMGTNINSINMWIPLNRCGGDTGAPGMDVVPRRLRAIVSAEGAQFNWSVSADVAGQHNGDSATVAPVFDAGDAFFFDHFFLHRTQYGRHFDKTRYAVETWFFGESCFPKNQIPLAW